MGLDVYLEGVYQNTGIPSKYPEHNFTSTYLRSSYNDSGFNRVVGALTSGKDLYYVFQPPKSSDVFRPDWDACLARAKELLAELKEKAEKLPYRLFTIDVDLSEREQIELPRTDEEVMAAFERELEKWQRDKGLKFNAYMNAAGHFFMSEPLQVAGLVRGLDCLGRPCLYVIAKSDLSYYVQAAEILVEEFLPLAIKNKDTAQLVWSG